MKKRILTVFLASVLLYSSAFAAEKYTQAPASETTTVMLMSVEDGKFNLLKNGGFETVNTDGDAVGWSTSTAVGEGFMVAESSDAASGKNFVRFWSDSTNISLGYSSFDAVPGETYSFSVMVRCPEEKKPEIGINITAGQKNEEGKYESIETFNKYETLKTTEWTEVSYDVTVPEGTERLSFLLRQIGGGESHWDTARFVGILTGEASTAAAFREMLAEEKAADDATNVLVQGELREFSEPHEGQSNLVKNGDFEDNDGKEPADWAINPKFADFMTIMEGQSHDGSDCVRLKMNGPEDGSLNPFYSQVVDLVGGAEYQVSFWYKAPLADSGSSPAVKMEYFVDRSLAGAGTIGEKYVKPEEFLEGRGELVKDGEWHFTSMKIYPDVTAKDANVLVRMMTSPTTENEIWFDDIQIYMTTPPPAFEVTDERIFYYPDMKEGTLKTNVNTTFFPELAELSVDYELLDSETVLWERRNVQSVDGKTTVTYDLELLKEKERPYVVRATLYNADGSVHSVATQNVYMYDRPEYLSEDGFFLKDGKERIYPIFGYHASSTKEGHLEKAATAGINLVQVSPSADPAEAKATMDKLHANGMMGLVVLYPGMKCAGNDANIESTISIVNTVKDHPATLAYIVMDEVFLHGGDPRGDLEASYRLIHSLDKKHPVCVMEANQGYYAEAAKYVDLLLIDPYSAAYVKNASTGTTRARKDTGYDKPVYSLLETYNTGQRWPTANDGRNNNWQALIAGSQAVGYYSVSDADYDAEGNALALWEANDGGALWNALKTFYEAERDLAYNHFIYNESSSFNEYRGEKYWYSSWVVGQDVYMIVLGMLQSGTQKVSVPLTSFAGDIVIGDYTATMLAGREKLETVSGNGTLDIELSDVEALFYKITPSQETDFSSLGITAFEDLTDFSWARQQIARMDEAGVITGRNTFSYAPAEKITRGEFAGFLVRALGLTADSTDQFADVEADYEFAKEIAIGKALGILKGTDGVNYNPDAEISRQDLMVICARGMRLKKELAEGAEKMNFTDAEAIADYAVLDIAAVVRAGIVRGNADGTLNPLGNTTRAEAAVIMDRIAAWGAEP